MKALVICPAYRPGCGQAVGPLVHLPVLGKSLIAVWLRTWLAWAREVLLASIALSDPPNGGRRSLGIEGGSQH
jgi:hypothetical protein